MKNDGRSCGRRFLWFSVSSFEYFVQFEALIFEINQVETVKEVNEVVKHAKETYNKVVTSRRCGKTIHAFIAAIGIEKIRQKSSDNLNSVLMPIAMIDQDSDSEVTIVQLSFGDVLYDKKTGTNLLQWPVEEIENLRLSSDEFKELLVKPGTVVPLHIGPATQDFSIVIGCIVTTCISQNGTSTTTTITTSTSTSFCVDETRSSKAPDVSKLVFGSKLPILSDEKLSLKVLLFEAKKTRAGLYE
ncbi:hypothetical protein S245_006498 [Arachis hypogaea]